MNRPGQRPEPEQLPADPTRPNQDLPAGRPGAHPEQPIAEPGGRSERGMERVSERPEERPDPKVIGINAQTGAAVWGLVDPETGAVTPVPAKEAEEAVSARAREEEASERARGRGSEREGARGERR